MTGLAMGACENRRAGEGVMGKYIMILVWIVVVLIGGFFGAYLYDTFCGITCCINDKLSAIHQNNIAIGVGAGKNLTTGSNNVLIGHGAGEDLTEESYMLVVTADIMQFLGLGVEEIRIDRRDAFTCQ